MPDTRESNSVVSGAFVGFQFLSEHGVSAVPSFQPGASAESQGDKGGRVRERTGQKAVKPKTLSSTLPSGAMEASSCHFSLMLSS